MCNCKEQRLVRITQVRYIDLSLVTEVAVHRNDMNKWEVVFSLVIPGFPLQERTSDPFDTEENAHRWVSVCINGYDKDIHTSPSTIKFAKGGT